MVAAWLVLNLIVDALMELALFSQTRPRDKARTDLYKVLESQAWASLEWLFLVPANRVASSFLSAPQISLSTFVFDFAAQAVANRIWLGVETTVDDYIGMLLMLLGMTISVYRLAD